MIDKEKHVLALLAHIHSIRNHRLAISDMMLGNSTLSCFKGAWEFADAAIADSIDTLSMRLDEKFSWATMHGFTTEVCSLMRGCFLEREKYDVDGQFLIEEPLT